MQIEMIDIELLKPYERNARLHSQAQIEKVAASIKEFGFTNPILIGEDNVVAAGHCRLEAAKLLGLKEVPTVKLSHLSKEKIRLYTIADNKLALDSTWDNDLLNAELVELTDLGFDISLTGFDDISELSKPIKEYTGAKELDEKDFQDFENKCPKCGFEFND